MAQVRNVIKDYDESAGSCLFGLTHLTGTLFPASLHEVNRQCIIYIKPVLTSCSPCSNFTGYRQNIENE
jgi:hypothetical protein